MDLRERIRSVPDFPKKGIVFRDITTLLKDGPSLARAVDIIRDRYREARVDKVVCVESRGFILGGALAYALRSGFVPIRKPGKLPSEKLKEEYSLEYGKDAVEIHLDAVTPGERVLLHDDLLATGGTMRAANNLVQKLGGQVVGISFLIELEFLHGRDCLSPADIFSVISYEKE